MSQVRVSTSGSVAKNLPANSRDARDLGSIPGGRNGNPLQYSYQKTPWPEEPGGLQSMGSQRVGHE